MTILNTQTTTRYVTNRQTDKCNPLKNGGEDKALKRDKRNPLKTCGWDITLQIDKQTEEPYRGYNFTSGQADRRNPLVQKPQVSNAGNQLTSFIAKTSR